METVIDIVIRTEDDHKRVPELEKYGIIFPIGTRIYWNKRTWKVSDVAVSTSFHVNAAIVTINDTGEQHPEYMMVVDGGLDTVYPMHDVIPEGESDENN